MSISLSMGGDWERKLRAFGAAAADGTKPLTQFDIAEKADIARQWGQAKASGGTVRGAMWEGFSPQYRRKDGTEVPAWGGVPKVRGKGSVLGKKRPSGRRVSSSSVLNQDTGRSRQALVAARPDIRQRRVLVISTRNQPRYGPFIFSIGNRNPVRWEPGGSQRRMTRIFNAHLNALARSASR